MRKEKALLRIAFSGGKKMRKFFAVIIAHGNYGAARRARFRKIDSLRRIKFVFCVENYIESIRILYFDDSGRENSNSRRRRRGLFSFRHRRMGGARRYRKVSARFFN